MHGVCPKHTAIGHQNSGSDLSAEEAYFCAEFLRSGISLRQVLMLLNIHQKLRTGNKTFDGKSDQLNEFKV